MLSSSLADGSSTVPSQYGTLRLREEKFRILIEKHWRTIKNAILFGFNRSDKEVRVQDKVESISHSKPLERRQEGNIRIQHAETSSKTKGISSKVR